MAGWFLVSYSCSQMVRPFLRGALSRLPGSLEASGQLVCLYSGCRHPVSKVEITSPFLTWPWKPHCMVFLVPGKAQTHLGLRRGHWLPSLDGIGQEILLMGIFGKTTGHDLPSGHNKFTSLPHAKYMAAIPRPSKSLMPIWFQAQAQPQSRALPSNHLPDTYL